MRLQFLLTVLPYPFAWCVITSSGQLHRVRSLPGMEENEDSRGHHRKYPLEHGGKYTWSRISFLKNTEKVKTFQNFFPTNLSYLSWHTKIFHSEYSLDKILTKMTNIL